MPRKALRLTRGTVLTGQRNLRGPLSRVCPTCHAQPGHSCVRMGGGKVAGQDIGGAYTVRRKTFHPERKKWAPPVDVTDDDVQATAAATLTLLPVHLTREGMSAADICAAAMESTRDDAINRALIYYARYVLGELP